MKDIQNTQDVQSHWQPIETAPKDGRKVLVLLDGQPTVSYWQDGLDGKRPEGWRAHVMFIYSGEDSPKYWIPIPPSP